MVRQSMVRRLIVMRHAKSAWDDDTLDDHARPLNERGRREAPLVGRRLVELDWIPDEVVSSDALRTRQTWQGVLAGMRELHTGLEMPVLFSRGLYLTGMDGVRDAVGDLPDATRTALVLGHNPGWEQVVLALTGEELTMKTAYAALLALETTDGWSDAIDREEAWELTRVLRPGE
jgi:phosphohistidine phosphatase